MNELLIASEFNVLDKLLFHTDLMREYTHNKDIEDTIDRIVNEIVQVKDKVRIKNYLTKLIIVPFQKRDVHSKYGDGERKVSYWAFIKMHSILPKTMEYMLGYFPSIGYWGDLNALYKIVFSSNYHYRDRLLNKIIDMWVFNLRIEENNLNNNLPSFSLLCKWIPKQKSSLDKETKVVNKIVKAYYPWVYKKNKFSALKKFRHLVSKINRLINTTEVYMCEKNFSAINYNNVPVKCLRKNKRAWLDETVKGKRKNLLLLDRTIGRHNYLDYLESSSSKNIYLKVTPKEEYNYSDLSLLCKLDNKYFNKYKCLIEQVGEIDCLVSLIAFNK